MEDLARVLVNGPLTAVIGSSSMQATNTVSNEDGACVAPGTPSEASQAADIRQPVVGSSGSVPVGTPAGRVRDGAPGGGHSWSVLPGNGMKGWPSDASST